MKENLTELQKKNLARGYTKNGYTHISWGRYVQVLLYTCKNHHENWVIKNWNGSPPRGGFYCNSCDEIITF